MADAASFFRMADSRQESLRIVCSIVYAAHSVAHIMKISHPPAGAPEEHHVMAKYKQSWLRLPTEYEGINVEVMSRTFEQHAWCHAQGSLLFMQTVACFQRPQCRLPLQHVSAALTRAICVCLG